MKIVFMGTAQFAVPILDRLHNNSSHDISAIVTNIDKPAGRGQKLLQSPVKIYFKDLNLPILQPEKLKDGTFIDTLKEINADIFVVVAYRILPEVVFSIPEYGSINLHASLLPKYRGPAPIQWALINGEKETGVTTFRIDPGVDTGKILLQKKIPILDDETAGDLAVKLAEAGAELVVDTLDRIEKNDLEETIQDSSEISRAPKITGDLMQIKWENPALEIVNLVRGLSPATAVKTSCRGINFKIFRAALHNNDDQNTPGRIVAANKNDGLLVSAGRGIVRIVEIQREGKKIMDWKEFIKGMPFKEGDIFE
ncbi:methionyl-tRNA formyltransferase [candidate division KSB1 bacterium]